MYIYIYYVYMNVSMHIVLHTCIFPGCPEMPNLAISYIFFFAILERTHMKIQRFRGKKTLRNPQEHER